MEQLKYFTKENNFYPGTNTPQFKNLEFWIGSNLDWINEKDKLKCSEPWTWHEYYKFMPSSIVSLGLFGEASAGKTSALRLAGKILGRPIITFNGAQFVNSSFEETIFNELFDKTNFKFAKAGEKACYDYGTCLVEGTKNRNLFADVIIFIDECHELPRKIQTKLLSLLEGPVSERIITVDYCEKLVTANPKLKSLLASGCLTKNDFSRDIILNGVIFAFATTDPSKLLQPLVTRLHRVVFDQYTLDDVVNIIKIKYPAAESAGVELLAKCSKFIPREAIRMAEQIQTVYKSLTKESCSAYLTGVINMDFNGLDSVDYRLLRFLIGNKKELSTRQKIDLETNKGILAFLLTKQTKTDAEHKAYLRALAVVSTLTTIQEGEFTPKGKDDVAMSCGLYDNKDVDRRLSYMQSLGLVDKTSRGIIYLPENTVTLDESKLI